jgi:branched-chain amino acid transport system permease protein
LDIDVLLGQAHDLTISSLVLALLALSVFATLSSGVFSVSTISLAALAGYTSGVLLGRGLPTEIMVPLGAIEGGVAALLLSYPLLRLASHRLALATIALLLVTRVIALNLTVTGGAQGIPVYRTLGDLTLFICVALTVWFFFRMRRSRFGLAIETVRADTSVAAAVGLNPTGVRRVAFVQSGVLAGVAGVLYASFVQYLSPDTYSTDLTFIVLAAVVLGGRFYWLGSIAGAFVFTILPFVLMNFISQGYAIANGIALIVIIILLPGGLIESGRRQQRRAAGRAARE